MGHVALYMTDEILALSIPPLAPGKFFPLPELPAGAPPSPAVLVLLAGLIAGTVLAGLGDKPLRPRRPHQDEKGNDFPDNKKVLKVFDAVEVVEDVLIRESDPLLSQLLLRSFINVIKEAQHAAHDWQNPVELATASKEAREAIFGPVADELEKRIRQKALQQTNDRFSGVWLERTVKRVGRPGGGPKGSTLWTQSAGGGHNKPSRLRKGILHSESGTQDV